MSAVQVLERDEIIAKIKTAPMATIGLTRHRDQLVSNAEQLAAGHYVCTADPEPMLPEILEGPHLDREFALHRARSFYGMREPYQPTAHTGEIQEGELPW